MPNLFDQTEITQLDRCLILYQYILWLNVSMEKTVLMYVVQAERYLSDNVSNLFVRKRILIEFAHLHHSVQIHV